MADTLFKDGQGRVYASWLNDVNDTIYKALGAGKTAAEVIAALGLATVATTGAYTDLSGLPDLTAAAITSGTINGTVIGGTTPAAITGTTGTFTGALSVAGTITAGGQLIANGSQPSGTYSLEAIGAAGASRSILLVGQAGYSNGFTVDYNGSSMVYALRDGVMLVNNAPADGINTMLVNGGIKGTVLNVDNGSGASVLNLNSANNTAWGRIQFNSGASHTAWRIGAQDLVNEAFEITPATAVGGGTFTTPAFLVRSNGHVQVGGYTQDSGDGFQVYGNIYATGQLNLNAAGGGSIYNQTQNLFFNTPNGTDFIFRDTSPGYAERMRLKTGGRLLINTATDNGNDALQVAGGVAVSGRYLSLSEDGTRKIYLRTSFNGNTPAIQVGTNDPLVFAVNSTEVGRFSTGYHFLIGTTTDNGTDALQVAGYGNFSVPGSSGQIKLQRTGDASAGGGFIGADNAYAFRVFTLNGQSGGFEITQNWRVLINTVADNGTDFLQVNGGATFGNNAVKAAQFTFMNGYALTQINGGTMGVSGCDFAPAADATANLGLAGNRWANLYLVNQPTVTSDARYKTFTGPSLGLDFINQLETHTGYWTEKGEADGLHQWLSAQQVEATLIKLGIKNFAGLSKPADAPMGLQYSEFIAPLIRAVQELSNRVKQLEKGAA